MMIMTRPQAIAIGCLAINFLEEAEREGKYRRGAHTDRPADDHLEAQHFFDLEQALKAVEADLGHPLP